MKLESIKGLKLQLPEALKPGRKEAISLVVAVVLVLAAALVHQAQVAADDSGRTIKVGIIYKGDESAPYTHSFIRAQRTLEEQYGDQLEVSIKNNVVERRADEALRALAEEGCEIVFTTSYGFGEAAKQVAKEYPEVEFCAATCDNANEEPVVDNYHTFMGEIYEGRYVSGVVAGMKLRELIDTGAIGEEEAQLGYVAAYPVAEVISGYTAFFLGVRSVVPTATMVVRYTNTWSSYQLERACALQLLDEGCVIIAQHSDTVGPAVACESYAGEHPAFSVGYNQSMLDVAPTTTLVSTRIDWTPYMLGAVEAVIEHERIESHVDAHIHGNDAGAGFEHDWVQMVELNEHVAAEGTVEAMEEVITKLKRGRFTVFKGDYLGVDPNDPSDTYDLTEGYKENENSSAPQFHYILQDVIEVRE